MRYTKKRLTYMIAALSLGAISAQVNADALPNSTTILEFAEKNTLFVADSDSSMIFAYKLPSTTLATNSESYNLVGAGTIIAELLGVMPTAVSYHDIAIHPVSKEAFISVSYFKGDEKVSAIIRANQKGSFERVHLNKYKHTVKKLENTANDSVKFWRNVPATTLAITDLDYVDGTLYVSGLSTGEFASTLRKIDYPFTKADTSSNIEIYHTVHNQTETRAPIRAMEVLKLNGVETVVAAYTCTPLVTIPTSSLSDGAHVKGKTIAELGYGNTPLDVIHFATTNHTQKQEEFVLVINKERSADLIRVADLIEANAKEGLSTPEMWAKAGVPTRPIPLSGVLQAADQDTQFIATLKRNLTTGDIDLVSFRKGAYFRLNDFISEYNFKDYKYHPEQEMFRNFQNLLKTDSGYPDLTRELSKRGE
ncbi:hypothetical protein L1D13_22245 [Vibrio tubiashii]|uniref:hypothetical protein n=1 Tax=Vibrio tubiashii TaxID=29498 RepID=UPI001EFC529A|nr:hypothetical protein [Vibrio tubiashii]MCG9580742.1 hypothetical protein [Vibrio tubiashii]MCG9614333.1 hypothetical protein [Vibrio tubiashii]MCG9689624.1 hypothetical protein [Vibrio tubiashii]